MPVSDEKRKAARVQMLLSAQKPVDPDAVQMLMFSIRLEAYCSCIDCYLHPKEINYREVYRQMEIFAHIEPKNSRGHGCISDAPLTVGSMLLKASDFIYHEDEYDSYYDPVTDKLLPIKVIGEYITDMLLVRPFTMI